MKKYSEIVQRSAYRIDYLLEEISTMLNEELTDELNNLLIVNKIKLEKMKAHCKQYLKEKK